MAKLEIGKGSIYTRYPNDTFRDGYDSIRWDSQKREDWCGTRYAMVEPEPVIRSAGMAEKAMRKKINRQPLTELIIKNNPAFGDQPDRTCKGKTLEVPASSIGEWIDRTEEYHALSQMGIDADSTE